MTQKSRNLTTHALAIMIFGLSGLWACTDDVAGPVLCSEDQDCPDGEICHMGVCRQECSTDMDCGLDEICEAGACLLTCSSDDACPNGEICLNGFCQPEPNQSDGGDGEDGGGDTCVDQDHDGYGKGCALGDDCNDLNNTVHPGAEELCDDNLDNNCDGNINENCACEPGSVQLCSSVGDPMSLAPPMRCRPGIQACVNGTWSPICEDEVGPVEETCNGIDDDCDGDVDEGVMDPLGGCNSTIPPEDCGPTGEGNGIDDNGDGSVDEGCSCVVPDYDPNLPRTGQPCYSGPIYTLGVGICQGGTRDCLSNGTWGPCVGETLPATEICGDALDNDCDAWVDEGCPWCTTPSPEECNGIDDDCDGVIDNGVKNGCGGCGTVDEAETCDDGLDNDCNGQVDDGCPECYEDMPCYPGPPETVNIGTCVFGTRSCDGEFWYPCTGFVLPTQELCGPSGTGNGIDEDCDGQIDDGCICPDGATQYCGDGAGACTYGTRTCANNTWGPCEGGTGPFPEVCDDLDNDCDGLVDEDLLNACGTCGESCYLFPVDPTVDGEADDGIEIIDANDADNPTGRAGITLTKNSYVPPYLWAANHTNNSVTKYNTELHQEEGIYWVGTNPSRTAVDLDGNMWVGGRDDGRLTKVLVDTSSCPDRNGVAGLQTSSGTDMINSAADPFSDECVMYSAVPNSSYPSIRGIAAGPDGRMWIGYSSGGVQSIDPATFELGPYYSDDAIQRWDPDGNGVLQPTASTLDAGGVYGLVVDSYGLLYTSSFSRNTLAVFNTNAGQEGWEAVYTGLCGSYGIGIDAQNRVWTGGWPNTGGVAMFDPGSMRFYHFQVGGADADPTPGSTRPVVLTNEFACGGYDRFRVTGVGVEPATGNVWASFYPIGYTGRLLVDETNLANSTWVMIGTTRNNDNTFISGVTADLRGVGFDKNGYAWTLGLGSDRVWKIDPATNARSTDLPNGDSIGVGSHYTYSDFTGSTALNFTSPRGYWRYIFESQFEQAQVDSIFWEAYVPALTSAGIRIRSMDQTLAPSSSWLPAEIGGVPQYFDYPVGAATNTVDLAANGGPLIDWAFEVDIRLSTQEPDIRPIVHDVRLEWQRP